MRSSRQFPLVIAFFQCLSLCFNLLTVVGAIVGGDGARVGEFPHMAVLGRPCMQSDLMTNDCIDRMVWFCGGSLIADRFVLTAAHCAHVDMPNPPTVVRLGAHDLQEPAVDMGIRAIVQHPAYGGVLSYNDIALVQLDRPVPTGSPHIRPAFLWRGSKIPKDVPLVASGWGKLGHFEEQSPVLQRVEIPIVPNDQCNKMIFRNRRLRYGVLPTQLCAGHPDGGKDTCEGDSGGPLQMKLPSPGQAAETGLARFYIVGITSNGGICGTVNRPGIYTRVSSYVGWIVQVLKSAQD